MNKNTHPAKVTHRSADGTFKKHPHAKAGKETASPTYLRDLVHKKGMNPDAKTLADPIMGHTNPRKKLARFLD